MFVGSANFTTSENSTISKYKIMVPVAVFKSQVL